jgi:predicted helicase
MEKIALEVDDRVAKAWKEAPAEKRRDIATKMNIRITRELFDYDKQGFEQYLEQLRNNMAERGLTQEILDDILAEG